MSTNSFKIKNSAVLTPKDLSTLVSPEAGEIACDINDSNKIKRYDAASASWVEVGSGGVGSVDIMFVQDFESASLSSFTQTGLSLSTTNPLHGKVSAVLTHQAAVNQSFKQTIPVDPKFRGQAMVLDLNVKSAASAGNVVIKVRDESNSADLIVSEALQLSNDVSGRRSSVSFTIPSTCSSLSYTITALPEAGSPVTRIDDIVAMLSDVSLLETSVLVPNLTAWQGYTPTFQGFGTPSSVEFEWRQVGESVEVRGKFVSGAPTAVEARVGLPAGLTSAGTSLIPSIQIVGYGQRGVTASSAQFGILIEPSVTYFTISTQSTGTVGIVKQNGNNILNTNDSLSFFASIPCAGLSATSTKTIPLTQSGLVQNADSMIRLDTINGYGSTGTKIRRFSNTTQSIGSDILYQDSAVNGASFTIQTSGIYSISYTDILSVAGFIAISKNASSLTTNASALSVSERLVDTTVAGANFTASTTWSGYLVAGDIIRAHTDGTAVGSTPNSGNFTISKQGSLKQVSVSSDQKITIPTSELRFEGASARGTGSEASTVQFQSLAKLRGDAFSVSNSNGTIITVLKKGKLSLSASLITTTASSFAITKNQVINSSFNPTVSEMIASATTVTPTFHASVSCEIYAQIGDIIRVSSGGTPNSSSFCNFNLAFQEQDIAVSVTNTLPQFSESDSSVRVDTANGYGSTLNNKIRRFSNQRDNIGTDIAYVDDPANGATFTVKSAGTYHISATDNFTAAGRIVISKNQSNLTATPGAIATSEILRASQAAAGNSCSCSWEGYLVAGDIVRLSTDGGAVGTDAAFTGLTISKVGKPNVTGVDVTPFVNVPQPTISEWVNAGTITVSATTTAPTKGAVTVDLVKWRRVGDTMELSYSFEQTSAGTAGSGTYLFSMPSGYSVDSSKLVILNPARTIVGNGKLSTSAAGFGTTTAPLTILLGTTNPNQFILNYVTSGETTANVSSTAYPLTQTFLSISFTVTVPIVGWTAVNPNILMPVDTFSTDTASLSYASSSLYNLTTLANAPVGTYITFTYAANTNTRTQTSTRPTQTDADMNANGMLIYTRAYNAASTAGNPAAIAIQIGKGLKGVSNSLYKSAGKSIEGSVDAVQFNTGSLSGIAYKAYNEVTGILYIDSGEQKVTTSNSNFFSFSDLSTQTSGYLVINASKSPALTGVPLLLPRIATLSDVKASGTAGGTATSGSYQTRTLNTLSDPSGLVTSLASNQFTLPAGEYYIEASAPAYNCELHKLRIQNVSDASTSLIGEVAYSRVVANAAVSALLKGSITISSAKTFELQHRVGTTQAASGFGIAASFGDNEVYASIKITKVK